MNDVIRYVSTTEQNPGPFDYTWKDERPGIKHLVISSGGAGSNVYVGILGTQCLGSGGGKSSIDVYNDLFPGTDAATVTVEEGKASGTAVYTAPKPASIAGIGVPKLQFSLKNIGAGSKEYQAGFPFYINSATGAVTTKAALSYTSQTVWTLFVKAAATGTGHDDCLRGGITLTVNVKASLKCGAGQYMASDDSPPTTSFFVNSRTHGVRRPRL